MRRIFRQELDELVADLVDMTTWVQVAVQDATRALLEVDNVIAERVISGDERIDQQHQKVERQAFTLMATQAPVAGELRMLVASLQMVAELGRMGDLAAHVAKIARMRYPEHAVPDALVTNFSRMSIVAQEMVADSGRVLAQRDVDQALLLAEQDEEIDELRSAQFRMMLGDDWPYGVEKAIDVALLGRYYERIADHAVAMGRRVIYIITGEMPEGEMWPST